MLPHLEASYNLALWLVRHPHDAEDAVQDAYLKAYKAFGQFAGKSSAAWLLKIVRNTCLTFLKRSASNGKVVHLDAAMSGSEARWLEPYLQDTRALPDEDLAAERERNLVRSAISQLPPEFREIVVLREFEDMSYQQIADITEVPVGTVMSRLSRARKKLRQLLLSDEDGGQRNEL